ncbi:MAG: hypothetical protein Q6K70_08975, partial [Thermostichales cyanobacterium DRC_bins_46]
FQKFESTMASLLDKVRHYSGHPNGDWQALSSMLDVLKTNAETLAAYQQEWNELLRNAGQHSR